MRNDAKRATAAQSTQNCRETHAQDMYENVYVVDCCVFLFVSAPASAANESKISCGAVVFLAKLCPHETHVVLRIFELRLRCHKSAGCRDV